MLNKFFEEWNAALKTQEIVKSQTDANGIVIWENTVFNFRGVVIENHKKPSATNPNEWVYELFVPSTKKFISNRRFRSRAECAAAIMMALIPGNDHEERRYQRIAARKALMTHRIMRERRIRMKKTNYSSEAKSFLMNKMHANLINNTAKFDDTLMNVLEKYCDQIIGFNIEDDRLREQHVDCLFENLSIIMSKTFTGQQGDLMISKQNANYLYRELNLSDRVPEFVRNVKKLIHDMDEYVHNPVKFIYCVNILVTWFEDTYKVSRDAKVAAATERRARSREKRIQHENRGGFSISSIINNGVNKYKKDSSSVNGNGFGQSIGDLLGDFNAADAPLPEKEDSRRKNKSKKSSYKKEQEEE